MAMRRLWLVLLVAASWPLRAADFQERFAELAADKTLSAEAKLHKLFDLDWELGLHNYPEFATYLGIPGSDDRWTDQSWEAIKKRQAEQQWPLAVIKTINRGDLTPADQLNYDLFLRNIEEGIADDKYPGELLVLSQLGGVQQSVAQQLEEMSTSKLSDYENILARMRNAVPLIEQNIDLLRRGLAQGVTEPKIVLREVPQQILNVIPDDPWKSAILEPFKEFPENISATDRERFKTAAEEVYKTQLAPAYRKFHDFVVNEYIPGAREAIGWNALPDGAAWYAQMVRQQTTTNFTPQEIHDIGLREVQRIRGEMDKIIAETGFKGTFEEFTEFLRTDPQFYYTKAEDLLTGYRDIAKRIEPELPRLFGKLPRLPYGIKAVPAYAEQSAAGAYYQGGSVKAGRAGNFFANTYKLPARPKWEMECLTLHEAVPGHHLQISLSQEMEDGPEFRKHGFYTAYVEGWGLYAESLGPELGLYKDPYARFGALTMEMWRAVRLVVDTGIHAFGWSRQQAIEYMMKNTGKEEHDSTVEIDRYIVWPGQALAYKIGQLKILELRQRAANELGEAFDLRAFHDMLLANGALPLDVLESVTKDWIAAQKSQTIKK